MKRGIEADEHDAGVDSGMTGVEQSSMIPAADVSENMTLRMWIANVQVGTIIGKGGSNVKGVREGSGCKVSIAEMQAGAPERLVSVTGSPPGVVKAVELMLTVLEEQGKENSSAEGATAAEGTTHVLKLMLSNNQVGGIIGKAGSVIKQMREESGASIKVESTATMQNERFVTVAGGKQAAISAVHHLVAKLSTMPDEGPPSHQSKFQKTGGRGQGQYGQPSPWGGPAGGPGGYAPPYAGADPGYPGGYPGQAPGYGAAAGGPPGYPSRGPEYPGSNPGAGYGGPAPGYGSHGSAYGQQGYPQQGYAGYDAAGASIPPSAWGGAPATAGPGGSMEQMVPVHLVGRLIGRGGTGIKELREVSHANIKIASECEPGSDQRKVSVTGTPDQMSTALAMISQRLAMGP